MTTSTTPRRSKTRRKPPPPTVGDAKGEQSIDRYAMQRSKRSTLDNLTMSRKEGFRAAAEASARIQPERLARGEMNRLSDAARCEYDQRRGEWHANLPTIRTAQLAELQDDLDVIVDSNQQHGEKAKGAVAVEGEAGIGKSIAVLDFAKRYHRETRARQGCFTDEGNERWPVCRVGMAGDTGIKDFNRAMLSFFAHAGTRMGTATEFADRALDCVLSCETRLLIVDDVHFLKQRATSIQISNQFKYISNEFPLTIIFIGIDLKNRGLYSDGTPGESILGQSGRRITRLALREFSLHDEPHRREWRQLLLNIEKHIVLAHKERGMLVEQSGLLWARSSGRIGTLTTLITRACHRAIRTGREYIDEALLRAIPLDVAADNEYPTIREQIEQGRMIVRCSRRDRGREPIPTA